MIPRKFRPKKDFLAHRKKNPLSISSSKSQKNHFGRNFSSKIPSILIYCVGSSDFHPLRGTILLINLLGLFCSNNQTVCETRELWVVPLPHTLPLSYFPPFSVFCLFGLSIEMRTKLCVIHVRPPPISIRISASVVLGVHFIPGCGWTYFLFMTLLPPKHHPNPLLCSSELLTCQFASF